MLTTNHNKIAASALAAVFLLVSCQAVDSQQSAEDGFVALEVSTPAGVLLPTREVREAKAQPEAVVEDSASEVSAVEPVNPPPPEEVKENPVVVTKKAAGKNQKKKGTAKKPAKKNKNNKNKKRK